MTELMNTPLFNDLRGLITTVDELRDIGLQDHIKLPRIVVVGSQSSGKSSLLENVVGLDFLPRGSGVVTRRPLELRMTHVSTTDGRKITPYAIFGENKNVKFTDFQKVKEQIQAYTDKVAGTRKEIVDQAITLQIFSADCPDLTIVDLPGITRVAIDNQDKDIYEVTKNMAMNYIRDDRTIILCVTPANTDLSTSDGIQLAKIADPQGKRTIGVLTKIDIMNEGTSAIKALNNKEIPLELGYVGVKNRSQLDIDNNMTVLDAIKKEEQYFLQNSQYKHYFGKCLGTKALTTKLTQVFFSHIQKLLPLVQKEISIQMQECEARLADLGSPLPETLQEKLRIIFNMITEFSSHYNNQIRGKYIHKSKQQDSISGGALITMYFNELFEEFTQKDFRVSKYYKDKDIDKAITRHQGNNTLSQFPSYDSFLSLITPQLQKFNAPAYECLDNVHQYLDQISQKLTIQHFERFPDVMILVQNKVSQVLQTQKDEAFKLITSLVDSEQSYLFTNDKSYLIHRTHFIPKIEIKEGQQYDVKKAFIDEIRQRVDYYFAIVLRSLRDSIPKLIGNVLINQSIQSMQFELYNSIMNDSSIADFLQEPPHIAEERKRINQTLQILKKSNTLLKSDANMGITTTSEKNSSLFG